MRTLAFRVEYDGTLFHGFQRQNGPLPTVQGLLEALLSQVLDEPVEAIGAGRTDAGVHAIGQVVHVRTRSTRALETVVRAVWRRAHGRLALSDAWEAPEWFHARHSATRRIYQYHLLLSSQPSPLLARHAWHVWRPLDLARMAAEAARVVGRRDFKAFQAGSEVEHFFRTVHRFEVRALPQGGAEPLSSLRDAVARAPLACLEIEADAFLAHMVRMLVGTLVEVGAGTRPPGTLEAVLRTRDPRRSSAAAPPHGLCLVRVEYPPAAWGSRGCPRPPGEEAGPVDR
jgi:tRNA pseudouridine38-40 synthase